MSAFPIVCVGKEFVRNSCVCSKTMPHFFSQRLRDVALLATFASGIVGCARLPDTEAILARHTA